ncbi:hypothetical protein LguiB_013791 [Lonicera macranthoides]
MELIQPCQPFKDETPRFVRWDLSNLKLAMQTKRFADIEVIEDIQNLSEDEQAQLSAHDEKIVEDISAKNMKVSEGEEDKRDDKKSNSVQALEENIEKLNKENNDLKERIIELETLLEVKQSGKLKHLPLGERGREDPYMYICNESHLEEPDDYFDFECETVVGDNHDDGFKTLKKYKEKPKEASVRSFVLRLKRRKRVQKDDSMFVYYLRDKKKVKKERKDVPNELEQNEGQRSESKRDAKL